VDENARYELGLELRRKVLGDTHVDHALSHGTEFSADFQEFVTRYSWGEVWSRAGLSAETRRLVTIALLAAVGHKADLETHIRTALESGIPTAHLREVLFQVAIYCGLPSADDAFRLTERILAEHRASDDNPGGNTAASPLSVMDGGAQPPRSAPSARPQSNS